MSKELIERLRKFIGGELGNGAADALEQTEAARIAAISRLCEAEVACATARQERDTLAAELQALREQEPVNARLLAIVHQTVGMIENTSIETGYCCCGDGMDGHASPMICGHSATDQGAYLAGLLYEDAKAAIAAAKSINEINALPDVPARELTDETIQRHWDEACKDTRKPMDGADTSVSPAPSADS